MKIRTALVTGATGFIGVALVRRLAERGVRTVCLVRENSPRKARLVDVPGIEIVAVRDASETELARAVESDPFDAVFHLAAYGVTPDERDAKQMVDDNAGLVRRMLAALARSAPTRFVFAGTCSEYGPAREPDRLREDSPLEPSSLYGRAKLAAEVEGAALARKLSIPWVTLRLFGVYGPGEAPHRLIPHLVARLRRGERPELTAGEQVRDLSYVDDVAEAFVVAAEHPGMALGTAYNVCSGSAVRIRDMALAVGRALGKSEAELGLGMLPYRSDEPMWIVGDPSRFSRAVGWRARTNLEEGVRRML